jgi:hypothetical protein
MTNFGSSGYGGQPFKRAGKPAEGQELNPNIAQQVKENEMQWIYNNKFGTPLTACMVATGLGCVLFGLLVLIPSVTWQDAITIAAGTGVGTGVSIWAGDALHRIIFGG